MRALMKRKIASIVISVMLFAMGILSGCHNIPPTVQIAPCTKTMLTSSATREGATGFIYTWIEYTNITHTACTLPLPPRIQLTDKHHTPLEIEYRMTQYEPDPLIPEPVFETTLSGDMSIVPAGATAMIIVRWESICPPTTPNGIIAHLTLSAANDTLETIVVDEERRCDEEGWIPKVHITGYKHAQR